jgi:hypothetical protein
MYSMGLPGQLPWRPEGILADPVSRSLFDYYIFEHSYIAGSQKPCREPIVGIRLATSTLGLLDTQLHLSFDSGSPRL